MSSAASRPPHTASLSAKAEGPSDPSKSNLRKPPNRSLLQPPARPKPPAKPPAPAATPAAQNEPVEEPPTPQRPGPISLPSEPMQYRAIGLLKGKYIASEEQFNRGDIAASDGTLIDAVLLGRVTSLIKKHIDLDKEHLWVVYPRTLYKEQDKDTDDSEQPDQENASYSSDNKFETSDTEEKIPALHVQIVGVWEPETLNADEDDEDDELRPLSSQEAEDQCDQFSIRGEISKYSEADNEILVNIVQKSKSENTKPKRPFKLLVNGQLTGRTVGYFWDLQVERQEGKLALKEGKSIAVVPPKKKAKGNKGTGRRRPPMNGKPKASSAPKPKPKPKTGEAESVSATESVSVNATQAVTESSET